MSDRLILAGIRIGLAAVWLVAARLAGSAGAAALTAFAVGVLGLVVATLADPRRPFFRSSASGASPRPRSVLAALFPSTFGVSVLTAFALTFQPTLAALLAGLLAGLGIVALKPLPPERARKQGGEAACEPNRAQADRTGHTKV